MTNMKVLKMLSMLHSTITGEIMLSCTEVAMKISGIHQVRSSTLACCLIFQVNLIKMIVLWISRSKPLRYNIHISDICNFIEVFSSELIW